jgi:hypothetical protein
VSQLPPARHQHPLDPGSHANTNPEPNAGRAMHDAPAHTYCHAQPVDHTHPIDHTQPVDHTEPHSHAYAASRR